MHLALRGPHKHLLRLGTGAAVAIGAGFFSSSTAAVTGPSQPMLRDTDSATLEKLYCAARRAPQIGELWKAGFFDASVEARRLRQTEGKPLKVAALEKAARNLAKKRHHSSFTFVQCSATEGVVLTFSAPKPVVARKEEHYRIARSPLDKACRSWRVDFAPAKKGPPRELSVSSSKVSTKELGPGTLSVTCRPKSPAWMGPELWALAPVSIERLPQPPAWSPAPKTLSLSATLGRWVANLRRHHELAGVAHDSSLTAAARKLAAGGRLGHDLRKLKHIGDSLDVGGNRLLGEDRVVGRSARQMAQLLWASARHRRFLLSPEARSIGVSTKRRPGGRLAVITLGRPVPTTP